MRNDKLIPGTILVIIGALFLLDNLGFVDFDWFSLFRLWPIILITAGVNLVFAHNRSNIATAIKITIFVAGMAILVFSGISHHHNYNHHNWKYAFSHSDNDNDNDNDPTDADDTHTGAKSNGHYQEAYKPATKLAVLNISGGATAYVLKDTTNNLFEAVTRDFGDRYSLTTSSDSTAETLNFDMNGEQHHHGFTINMGNNQSDKAILKLNTSPEWEINVEAGAASINFDLSKFKVRQLKLEGGAASFNVKMGQPVAETNLDISTGVSKVRLHVPRNAACHITTDAGISSKSFNGFQSIGDDEYETPNFKNGTNKMYIKISGGVSDFGVDQY